MSKLRTKVYLHGSREANWSKGEKLGLVGEALRLFSFACYEVEVELEVETSTGEAQIVKVNGKALQP